MEKAETSNADNITSTASRLSLFIKNSTGMIFFADSRLFARLVRRELSSVFNLSQFLRVDFDMNITCFSGHRLLFQLE
jgi:hypothetical protein